MALQKPRVATVRLTEAQHRLAREQMGRDRGVTFQKILTAAVNAYIRGDFRVHPDGSYTVGSAEVVFEGDDPDALDLDGLDTYVGETGEVWGTRELAAFAEEQTGRRVSLPWLRRLVRERFPQSDSPGPGTRYRWTPNDPDVARIVEAIDQGALDELKGSVMQSVTRSLDVHSDDDGPRQGRPE